MVKKLRLIVIICVLLAFNLALSQCKLDSSQLKEIKNVFKNLTHSKESNSNLLFQIGNLPDVDFLTLTKNACITKSQVLDILKLYNNTFKNLDKKNAVKNTIEKLKVMLDDDNYYLEITHEEHNNKIKNLNCHIRNSHLAIFINPYLYNELKNNSQTDTLKTTEWLQIEDIFNRFDKSFKYRCASSFTMGYSLHTISQETNSSIISGLINEDQLLKLFNYCKKLCSTNDNMILENISTQKLISILDCKYYNIKLVFSQDQNKVNEIKLIISNQNMQLDFLLFRVRNEAGEIIR